MNIFQNKHVLTQSVTLNAPKWVQKSWNFRKSSMGTQEKYKNSTKWTRYGNTLPKTRIFGSRTVPISVGKRFEAEREKSRILNQKSPGSVKIFKNQHFLEQSVTLNAPKWVQNSRNFRKSSMGTQENYIKLHETNKVRWHFAQNTDFRFPDGSDHCRKAVWSRARKITNFEPKIAGIGENLQKSTLFGTKRYVKHIKMCAKIAEF